MRLATLLAFVIGCKEGGVRIDETDTGDTVDTQETDAETDTETDDTQETDTVDTALTIDVGGVLIVDPEATPPAGIEIVLLGSVFSGQDELSNVDRIWATGRLDGTPTAGSSTPFTFHLPMEPEDEEFAVTDPSYPRFEIAGYAVGAYSDSDGVPGPSEGDDYVAARAVFVAYARGELSPEAIAIGARLGWNLVVFDPRGDATATPLDDGDDGYELPANLLPHMPADLPFVLAPSLGGVVAVGLVNGDDTIGMPTLISTTIFADEEDLAGTIPGPIPRPPEREIVPLDDGSEGMELYGAAYVGLAWNDADNDGDFDLDEVPRAVSSEGRRGSAAYYVECRSFQGGLAADMYGLGMGWNLISTVDGGGVLDWDAMVIE